MTFKEYILNEAHSSKYFDEMINIAREYGCTVRENGVKHIVYAPASIVNKLNLPQEVRQRTCDKGEKGAHPLRKWLKNTLQIKDSRLNG